MSYKDVYFAVTSGEEYVKVVAGLELGAEIDQPDRRFHQIPECVYEILKRAEGEEV